MVMDLAGGSASASFFNFLFGVGQAYYTHQAGQSQKRQAEFNSAQAVQASRESQKWAAYSEKKSRRKGAYLRGQMVVDLLKNGVAIDEGTSADALLMEQEIQDEMEALEIRSFGAKQTRDFLSQAALFRFQGKSAESLAKTQVAVTLLGTTAKSVQLSEQGR